MDSVSQLFPAQLHAVAAASLKHVHAHGLAIDSHNTAPDDWVFLLPRSTPSHVAVDNRTRIKRRQQHPEALAAGSRTKSAH